MAEIKVDLINYCNVNMSSPNSCNSSKLNSHRNPNEQNQSNNQTPKSSPSNSNLNKQANNLNNSNQSNHTTHHTDSTKKLSNESTTKFYVDNNSTVKGKSQKPDEIAEQNEIIDQFDDSDHFDSRSPLNDKNFVTNEDIGQVLKAFQEKAFRSFEFRAKDEKIQLMCLSLFNYDYETEELMIINNSESELSASYPSKIIVPKTNAFAIDHERLRNLIMKAKYARCRCRFPVPVILFNNKYVCRSATLSHCIEIYSRQSYASFFKSGEEESQIQDESQIQEMPNEINELNLDSLDSPPNFDIIDSKQDIDNDKMVSHHNSKNKSNSYFSAFKQDYSHTVNEARAQDILLLNYLNVKHIIDLMVEMKKVKYGIYVASSEKADKLKRYRDFNINVLPYPGCEYFKFYRDNNYQAEGLIYDWSQAFVDAELSLIENDLLNSLNINFNNYKKWDLNNLTLNYLKLILTYLVEPSNESILLHCISGWDRTSEFVSLVRLSLWADYELHPNLNYEQILYLTLGYDWYLFGHDLSDRVDKGEEIMHFCFYFLKFLSSAEYSIDYLRKNIIKRGNEYVRVRFNCCGICKLEEEQANIKNADEMLKQINNELDDEISSSMYSSQASTVVNNNLKKDRLINKFNQDSDDESVSSDQGPDTPRNLSFNSSNDAVDHLNSNLLTNSTTSTKTFVIDPNFDQNISASPSSFTSAFKELRNNSATSLNRNSLIIERDSNDLNYKFDIISLDDQSLSSNSSYDVLHAANNKQQANNQHSSTPTNQAQFNIAIQNGSPHQPQQSPPSNIIAQPTGKQSSNNTSDLSRKDSFSCGSPPQLLSSIPNNNCCEIADDDARNNCRGEEDILSSSCESTTLAEDTVDSNDSRASNSNIQRSNAVAIPSRNNRQSANAYNSSTNSNLSNRLSDQSFNLNRCDSWQIVTGTGSVKDKNFLSLNSLDEIKRNMNMKLNGSTSSSSHLSPVSNRSNKFKHQNDYAHNYVPTCCCKNLNCGKHCEKVGKYNKEKGLEKCIYTRQKRLSDVRVVFYQCYSKYIGLSTANGSSNEITAKFSNLIEKIKYPFRGNHNLNGNGFTRNGSTRLSNRKPTQSFQSYIEDSEISPNNKNENLTS